MAAAELELLEWNSVTVSRRGGGVGRVTLRRPTRANAIDDAMLRELPQAVAHLDACGDVRAIILDAAGRNFCSGIDLGSLASLGVAAAEAGGGCPGRQREALRRQILAMQASATCFEACRKPVVAAIQGACVGGGVDLVTACDLRYCTSDASFAVKEVDLGITADLGTLQRLPRLIGDGAARELALTARTIDAAEAHRLGLVHGVHASAAELATAEDAVAQSLAAKSPLAIAGTKAVLLHARDHSVADGLDYAATWNAAMLASSDLDEILRARQTQRPPTFAKL